MSGTDKHNKDISGLQTEQMAAGDKVLDQLDSNTLVGDILQSQIRALIATASVSGQIAAAVDAAAAVLSKSDQGRLTMLGAGASGRIAVQDGAELWPTFGWSQDRLVLKIAGGFDALVNSIEGAEDDPDQAQAEVGELCIGPADVVLGIAASGRSPYTVEWITRSRAAGALTVAFSNNPDSPLLAAAQYGVTLDSGPEVLTGSTRMAAGTSQKAALNAFSTALMVRLNRTWGNLMVDMAANNVKLASRRRTMLRMINTELTDEQADVALSRADGWVKLACLISVGMGETKARELLQKHNGSLRLALDSVNAPPR